MLIGPYLHDQRGFFSIEARRNSASFVTSDNESWLREQRYYPYGETRLTTGTIYTDKLFTGHREMTGLGIDHYGTRFYSPKTGRLLSADIIAPGAAIRLYCSKARY